jgi:hypothetical protein
VTGSCECSEETWMVIVVLERAIDFLRRNLIDKSSIVRSIDKRYLSKSTGLLSHIGLKKLKYIKCKNCNFIRKYFIHFSQF